MFKDREFGYEVRIPFSANLTPTSSPLVFDYHPGSPSGVIAPTIQLRFTETPFFSGEQLVILGTVSCISPDGRWRPSGNLGVVVISHAKVVLPERP